MNLKCLISGHFTEWNDRTRITKCTRCGKIIPKTKRQIRNERAQSRMIYRNSKARRNGKRG